MDKVNLNLFSGELNLENYEYYVGKNILPVFVVKNLRGSDFFWGLEGTAVHIPELSPDPELYRSWKYLGMSDSDFLEEFRKELQKVNVKGILKRIKLMTEICSSAAAVLLGNGPQYLLLSYLVDIGLACQMN